MNFTRIVSEHWELMGKCTGLCGYKIYVQLYIYSSTNTVMYIVHYPFSSQFFRYPMYTLVYVLYKTKLNLYSDSFQIYLGKDKKSKFCNVILFLVYIIIIFAAIFVMQPVLFCSLYLFCILRDLLFNRLWQVKSLYFANVEMCYVPTKNILFEQRASWMLFLFTP